MTTLVFPLYGLGPVVTSPFGWRTHPTLGTRKFHNGADLRAPQGSAVVAPAAGTVISIINNDVCGYGMIVQHDGLRTGYCHMSRLDVQKGSKVRAGQRLGLSGGAKGTKGAGRSTGSHLHWIVYEKKSGKWTAVDPMLHLGENGASSWPTITGMWDAAQEFWEEIWETPSVDPAVPARKATSTGLDIAGAFWQVNGVPMQIRLVDASGRTYGPGAIPSGVLTVQAFNGRSWVNTGGQLQATHGHNYRVSESGGRLQVAEM